MPHLKAPLTREKGKDPCAGYTPKTAMGRAIMEIRAKMAARGEKFLTLEELDAEVEEMRERNHRE